MAGEGCLQDQPEPWAPSPSLPLPSQGEGPRQELAAEAAPTDVVGMTGDAPDIAHHAALDARMVAAARGITVLTRSEEHTSELQSLMRISYAVFCLKKTQSTQL